MRPRAGAALLAFAAILPAAEAARGDESFGFVAAQRGQAAIGRDGEWRPATQDDPVSAGDALRTGPDAALKVLLADDTLALLDAATLVRVGSEERAVRLRLRKGRVRAALGAETTALHTATAAVHGTATVDVFLETAPELTTYVCAVGAGARVRNLDPAVEGELRPPAGACVRVARGSAPEPIGWRPLRLARPMPELSGAAPDPPLRLPAVAAEGPDEGPESGDP